MNIYKSSRFVHTAQPFPVVFFFNIYDRPEEALDPESEYSELLFIELFFFFI